MTDPIIIGDATLYHGEALEVLRTLPAGSAHCCVTSPPYWGLRDYGTGEWEGGDPECDHRQFAHPLGRETPGGRGGSMPKQETVFRERCGKCGATRIDAQLGLETTPEEYVARLVGIFREVRRVLRDDGTLWLNLGDSYNAQPGQRKTTDKIGAKQETNAGSNSIGSRSASSLKPKDLVGIPWRVAFALQADGWVLRQEIIWQKKNPMPESVKDRCTKAHEQIFMLSKGKWTGPDRRRFDDISDEDARWLALLIDTEGCVVVKRSRIKGRCDVFAPQVSVGNTSMELMERVVEIVGHGNILERGGKNAPVFYWQLSHSLAADFLYRIYPHLIVKHRQAAIGVYVDSLTYRRGGQRPERKQRSDQEQAVLVSLWERNKSCNQFGEPDLSDVPEPKYGRWTSQRYYYDAEAIREPDANTDHPRHVLHQPEPSGGILPSHKGIRRADGRNGAGRNKRTVWTVATQPYPEAHFATYPPKLIESCILAGCPAGGTVLDPFCGSGTTGEVCGWHGRKFIGIDLSADYLHNLAAARIQPAMAQARLLL